MLERTLGLTIRYAGEPEEKERHDAKDLVADNKYGKLYDELNPEEQKRVRSWIEWNGKKVE